MNAIANHRQDQVNYFLHIFDINNMYYTYTIYNDNHIIFKQQGIYYV